MRTKPLGLRHFLWRLWSVKPRGESRHLSTQASIRCQRRTSDFFCFALPWALVSEAGIREIGQRFPYTRPTFSVQPTSSPITIQRRDSASTSQTVNVGLRAPIDSRSQTNDREALFGGSVKSFCGRRVFFPIPLFLSPLLHIYSTGTCAPDRTGFYSIVSMAKSPFGHKTLKICHILGVHRFPTPRWRLHPHGRTTDPAARRLSSDRRRPTIDQTSIDRFFSPCCRRAFVANGASSSAAGTVHRQRPLSALVGLRCPTAARSVCRHAPKHTLAPIYSTGTCAPDRTGFLAWWV